MRDGGNFSALNVFFFFLAETVNPKYGGNYSAVMRYGGNISAVNGFTCFDGNDLVGGNGQAERRR